MSIRASDTQTDAAWATVPVVVQHSWGALGTGGPIGALERILASPELEEKYEFVRLHQQSSNGWIDFPRLWQWTRQLRRIRPDVVHVRGLGNEGFHGVLAARLAGCPRVLVSIHGTIRDLVGTRTWRQRVLIKLIEPLTLRLATHVTTVCHFAADREFVRPYRHKLVGPITNGVTVLGLPAPAKRAEERAKLGIRDDETVLMTVGRLTFDKGHHELANALSRFSAQEAAKLILISVGDGPDRTEIERVHSTTGVRTVFLGTRLDVGDLLAAADVFVFPSLQENLPNALLEAMSRGLPVVTTTVAGIPEIVEPGAGKMVSPGSGAEFASALQEVLDNRAAAALMGQRGLDVIRARYSVESMCSSVDNVYRQMMTG